MPPAAQDTGLSWCTTIALPASATCFAQPTVCAVHVEPVAEAASITEALRAAVACRCGAFARALQYFEIFVRQQHGGGLNPAAYLGGCSRCVRSLRAFSLTERLSVLSADQPSGAVHEKQKPHTGMTSTSLNSPPVSPLLGTCLPTHSHTAMAMMRCHSSWRFMDTWRSRTAS